MKTRKILTNDNSNFLTNEAPPISFSSLCFLVTTQLLSHHKIFQCVSSYGSSSYSGHSATSRCCGYPTSGWLVVPSSRRLPSSPRCTWCMHSAYKGWASAVESVRTAAQQDGGYLQEDVGADSYTLSPSSAQRDALGLR